MVYSAPRMVYPSGGYAYSGGYGRSYVSYAAPRVYAFGGGYGGNANAYASRSGYGASYSYGGTGYTVTYVSGGYRICVR